MNEYVELFLGVSVLILGIVAIYFWRSDVLMMLKGIIGPFLALIGLVLTWVGFTDIREK